MSSWHPLSQMPFKFKVTDLLTENKYSTSDTKWALETINRFDQRQLHVRRCCFMVTLSQALHEGNEELLLSELSTAIESDFKILSWVDTEEDRLILVNRLVNLVRTKIHGSETEGSLEEYQSILNLYYGCYGDFSYEKSEPWVFKSTRSTHYQLRVNLDLIAFRYLPETRQVLSSSNRFPFILEPFYRSGPR